jgi:multicomponent Na+:H+ antiporter subunit D
MEVFWKTTPEKNPTPVIKTVLFDDEQVNTNWMKWASGAMAIIIVLAGVFAAPIVEYCTLAAESLMQPSEYINFVLENGAP